MAGLRQLLILLSASALAAGVARAQPAPAGEAPVPDGEAPVPAGEATVPDDPRFPEVIQPPPGFDRDPAWSEYDGAFRDAAAGDVVRARARLAELAARWPTHPAGAQAAELARRLGPRRGDPDAPSKVARSELVFWSTVGGVSLAANLCVVLDCSSDRAWAGTFTLTVGGALAASVVATRRGVRAGEAQLYNSAQTWGAWNAVLVNDELFAETPEQAGVAIAMQLGGLAAGVGLWQLWRPTAGDVALTNTFLLWGTVLTLWGHLIADEEPSLRTVVAAGDAALVAGALLSRVAKVSRGRTLLIDIGGVLGSLGGGLLAISANDEAGAGVALTLGTTAGLALAVLGTRGWDKAPPVQVAPAVIEGPSRSKGYGVSAGFAF